MISRLIPQPAKSPFGGSSFDGIILDCLFGRVWQQIHQLAAPQRFHDDDRNLLFSSIIKPLSASLGVLRVKTDYALSGV